MANFEIRKKPSDIWEHNWTNALDQNLILSAGYFTLIDQIFSLRISSGGEIRTSSLEEIIVYDDTDMGTPETFTTGLAFTTRLKALDYPYFRELIPVGAGVTTSVALTNNFLVRGNGVSDIDIGAIFMSSDGQDLTIPGDLTVQGTTVTLDVANVLVEDKNIELGVVTTPTDVTADGGGITLKGSTDKTIIWVNATDSWTFNQQLDVGTNKIINVVNPSDPQDVATKDYVDGVSGGDMLLAGVQTNTGIKTFLDTTMKLRNVANTFDGYFVNTNTADRIYTLQDLAGTLAFLTDIPTVSDIAYNATSWDGNLDAATKNAIRDKIETLGGGGDMVLADAQTNTGIKTFLDTTMKLRNVANTFDGYFVNTNTADRIYTLQDAAGVLAFVTRTIVNITGTKAQFDVSVTDGDFLYVGDVTSNVTTNLSLGAITPTTMVVVSSDGTDATLIEANTDDAGLLGATKWDEIVANTLKVSNVSTDLSMGTVDGTQYVINSSDGNNVSLPLADTNNWGIISDEIFDEIVVNNAKVGFLNLTGDVTSIGPATTISVGAVDLAMLSATGTPTASNFLRGDNTWATPAGSGDMVLADAQTNTGIKTFLDTTMKLRNVANTFDGYFVNTNTADRIYTLPDAAGTVVITGLANQITNTELTAGAFAKITGVGTITSGTWSATDIAVAAGGTGLSAIAAGSVWVANSADTIIALTSTSGTRVLTNTAGTLTWEISAGGGDMVLADAQTNTGIKTFLDTTMKLRNVANSFDGYFVNTNTADRIYTLQDAAGTIAFVTRTLVGITGTKAQFDTACTDGDFMYIGDPPTAHTIESHSDVTITAIAANEILKWSGAAWINNTLVEAGIKADFSENTGFNLVLGTGSGQVAEGNHTHLLSAGATDVNATAGELNILDLSATALTVGWAYFADGASTASWRQLLLSELNDDKTYTKSIWIEDPTASDDIGLWSTDVAITLTKVETYTVGGTSVSFNISHNTNPTTITDLWSSDKVANTTTTVQTHSGGVNDDTVAAGEAIRYMASGAVGNPTGILLTIFYTID
ncbi:MAG: beta strand repeat-containing protein [Candidatus Anammoxibacter sp.]